MQVNFGRKENEFKVPHYKVGDEVLAFSYISVTSYADNNQSVVNYTIMIDETKGVPNVPEELVFDNKNDAYEWTRRLQNELSSFN